ncbi:NUC121 domain-containing protein [Suillus ampliporus]|nr:NUC121 domain-containing protein [Suillus ampliporus]
MFQRANGFDRQAQQNVERDEARLHLPFVNQTPDDEPPPVIVAIVGPRGVGKTTLLQSLVRRYSEQTLSEAKGPITVVAGKERRLTFIECNNDFNSMIEIGKVADLVLLMIDGSYGFEMETFEFLNLPHFIGGMKFCSLIFRNSHLYLLADRMEDSTPHDDIRISKGRCDRTVTLYGYLRGTNLRESAKMRIPGVGDMYIKTVTELDIPCPLLDLGSEKRRKLSEKKKSLVHAPVSDGCSTMYDQDAAWINVPGHFTKGATDGEQNSGLLHLVDSW